MVLKKKSKKVKRRSNVHKKFVTNKLKLGVVSSIMKGGSGPKIKPANAATKVENAATKIKPVNAAPKAKIEKKIL